LSEWSTGEIITASKLNQKELYIGASAPASPTDGQLWWDSTNKKLFEYDASSATWKQVYPAKISEVEVDADKDFNTKKITNLGAPVASNDAARKAEVDNHAALTTGIHGVGASYLAKTSRADQLLPLGELYDVDITSPADGDGIVYNSSTGKWENKPVSALDSLLQHFLSGDVFVTGVDAQFAAFCFPDVYTDKAIETYVGFLSDTYYTSVLRVRLTDYQNTYYDYFAVGGATPQRLYKVVSGTQTQLASGTTGPTTVDGLHYVKLSALGSTIKSYLNSITPISATDTSFASGKLGVGGTRHSDNIAGILSIAYIAARLVAAGSPAQIPQEFFEVEVVGSGSMEDPFRPNLPDGVGFSAIIKTGNDGKPTDYVSIVGVTDKKTNEKIKGRKLDPTKLSPKIKKIDDMLYENEIKYFMTRKEIDEIDAVADFYEREVLSLGRIKVDDRVEEVIKQYIVLAERHRPKAALRFRTVLRK